MFPREGVGMTAEWFLALDGDDIGRKLELFMLTNDIESLSTFASAFDSTINSLVQSACGIDGVDLVLFGGDSVMLKVPDSALKSVLNIIKGASGQFTFSGGYATSMRGAYLALKLAKTSGKDRVEGPLKDAHS